MNSYIAFTNPKAYFIGIGVFVLISLVWLVLDHYIFSPRRVKKIVEEIRKKQNS